MTYLEDLIPQRRYSRKDYLGILISLLPRGRLWRIPLPDEKDISPPGIASAQSFGNHVVTT